MSRKTPKASTKKETHKETVLKNWPEQRKMGRMKYILKFGITSWGAPTFAIYWLLMTGINAVTKNDMKITPYQLAVSFMFFLLFGLAYSTTTWYRNEKIFREKYPYKK
ncbi:hypothetical protein KHM83_16270 [Fusibacter paucivorans]|uniref:Uncharacterized protein n=1 Tax=Fusibacter paucivorans TaxID=76009 RepID=A0ABS5PSU3_9FIRM|nr:hypothetical protein [Fusibacter paucivorans]MBS7528245.1 hypothetical protein [Fusibacter paucivorans]